MPEITFSGETALHQLSLSEKQQTSSLLRKAAPSDTPEVKITHKLSNKWNETTQTHTSILAVWTVHAQSVVVPRKSIKISSILNYHKSKITLFLMYTSWLAQFCLNFLPQGVLQHRVKVYSYSLAHVVAHNGRQMGNNS